MAKRKNNVGRWVLTAHVLVVIFVALPISFSSCGNHEIEVIPVQVIQQSGPPDPSASVAPAPDSNPPEIPPSEPPSPEPPPPPKSQTAPPEPRPDRPRNHLRTAEEIRQSAKLDPVEPAPQTPARRTVDPSELENKLKSRLNRISSNVAVASHDTAKSSPNAVNRYINVLSGILYKRWSQPSLRETGGARPTASVRITVRSDGRVASARIVRPSNNGAMDASIRQLVAGLDRLPALSAYNIRDRELTVTIKFELTP